MLLILVSPLCDADEHISGLPQCGALFSTVRYPRD